MRLVDDAEVWLGQACGRDDLFRHRLVHAERTREHARSDVGEVGNFEHALHCAVLAEWPV